MGQQIQEFIHEIQQYQNRTNRQPDVAIVSPYIYDRLMREASLQAIMTVQSGSNFLVIAGVKIWIDVNLSEYSINLYTDEELNPPQRRPITIDNMWDNYIRSAQRFTPQRSQRIIFDNHTTFIDPKSEITLEFS
jgi:hypothetical protein